MENYCRNCGKKLDENDQFCPGCGTRASQIPNSYQTQYQENYYRPYQKTPTQTLADRERASAIIWTVIASLQGAIGLLTVTGLSLLGSLLEIPLGLGGVLILALAAYNGYGAYCSFQRVKRVLSRQRGIVWEYDKMLSTSIIFIVLNALFGAVIGVAGAVFDLFNRNYALSHAQYLEDE